MSDPTSRVLKQEGLIASRNRPTDHPLFNTVLRRSDWAHFCATRASTLSGASNVTESADASNGNAPPYLLISASRSISNDLTEAVKWYRRNEVDAKDALPPRAAATLILNILQGNIVQTATSLNVRKSKEPSVITQARTDRLIELDRQFTTMSELVKRLPSDEQDYSRILQTVHDILDGQSARPRTRSAQKKALDSRIIELWNERGRDILSHTFLPTVTDVAMTDAQSVCKLGKALLAYHKHLQSSSDPHDAIPQDAAHDSIVSVIMAVERAKMVIQLTDHQHQSKGPIFDYVSGLHDEALHERDALGSTLGLKGEDEPGSVEKYLDLLGETQKQSLALEWLSNFEPFIENKEFWRRLSESSLLPLSDKAAMTTNVYSRDPKFWDKHYDAVLIMTDLTHAFVKDKQVESEWKPTLKIMDSYVGLMRDDWERRDLTSNGE